MKNIATHLAFVILLTACGQQSSETTPVASETAEPDISIYATALENSSRPAADLSLRLFGKAAQGQPGDIPEYLFETKLRGFVAPHCEPSIDQLGKLAGPTVVEFVERRHGKLGVPLEVRGMDERSAERRWPA